MDSHAWLHRELIGLLRQHCPVADERHLVLLGWMVAGLLLSQNVCFGHWQQLLPLHPCQASSWQRRCRRWLSNGRVDPGSLYGPLVLWAMQGIFQLERSGLRDPARIDRLLLVVSIAVLLSSLQGFAVSLSGQRRLVDPYWKRGLSFARIGLHWLQQSVTTTGRALLPWMPIPLQALEPCVPSRAVRRRQKRPWFSRIELPRPPHPTGPLLVP